MADIKCANCSTTGDDSLGTCRFCGAEIKAAPAPAPVPKTVAATDKKSTPTGQ